MTIQAITVQAITVQAMTAQVAQAAGMTFDPTWVEWVAFGVINAIIVGIHAALYFRGNLRKVDHIYDGDGKAEES